MPQKLITLALFGAITLPVTALADISHQDEIVVTATRLPQALNKTLADTTVLNEQEIRQSGAPDVATLLRSVTGIEISQNGGLGTLSSVYMRGTSSTHVLILIDGVRVNSATAGSTALEHLMLDSIERIEVVRGNVSSLYGSEAIGGVIQLFTKQGHGDPAAHFSLGIGNQGTQRLTAGFSGKIDSTSFSINAGRVNTNGVSAMNPRLAPKANPNNNGYDNNTVNAQLKHEFNADHALSAAVLSTRGNASFDSAFGAPTDLNNTVENIDKLSLSSDDQLSEMWHSKVRLAQGVDDSHTFLNGAPNGRFQTQSNQLAWQNNLTIAAGQQLSLSAENLRQTVSSSTAFTQATRTVNSLLGGYTGEFGAQQIQLNARQDQYSDFGVANTGLLGYGIAVADNWRAAASLSNAFKAPTFNDMYYPLSFGYQGNPNLQPEQSRNKEVGLHYAAEGHRVDAVYFDNRIRNLIAINTAGTTMLNLNQAQITGEELSYAGDFGSSHLHTSLTWQNPHNASTGAVLDRRAKRFGNLAATHDFAAWNVGGEMRFSGVRQDGTRTLSGYSLFNLTSRYTLDPHLSLMARVDNLANRNYSEAYQYNTLGRTLFVGMTYQQ